MIDDHRARHAQAVGYRRQQQFDLALERIDRAIELLHKSGSARPEEWPHAHTTYEDERRVITEAAGLKQRDDLVRGQGDQLVAEATREGARLQHRLRAARAAGALTTLAGLVVVGLHLSIGMSATLAWLVLGILLAGLLIFRCVISVTPPDGSETPRRSQNPR